MRIKHKINLLPAFALMLTASMSNAYYLDSNTGLEWLELTETQNESYNTVIDRITTGDLYGRGWRYATGDEFDAMVTGFGTGGTPGPGVCSVQQYCGWSVENNGLVTQLLGTFGDLTGDMRAQGILGDAGPAGTGRQWTGRFGDSPSHPKSKHSDWIHSRGFSLTTNQINGAHYMGSFLLRSETVPVPEPATVYLFIAALAGWLGTKLVFRARSVSGQWN